MSRPNHKVPDNSNHPANQVLLDNTNQVLQDEPNHTLLEISPKATSIRHYFPKHIIQTEILQRHT